MIGSCSLFKQQEFENSTEVSARSVNPNLTINAAESYILNHVPPSYQRMIASNFSFGLERDPEVIAQNDNDHRKWANPLEVRLPNAPSMKIHCRKHPPPPPRPTPSTPALDADSAYIGLLLVYGVGKETERAYFYQEGQYEHDEAPTIDEAQSVPNGSSDVTPRVPLDMPLSQRVWVDSSINIEGSPQVRSGVVFGEGDGTVSLLSLGSMCVDGWKVSLESDWHVRRVVSGAGSLIRCSFRGTRSATCTTLVRSR